MQSIEFDNFRIDQCLNLDDQAPYTVHTGPTAMISSPMDVTTIDLINATDVSGVLDFWNDPAEDQYSDRDGDAI